jgi:hypothetical protein
MGKLFVNILLPVNLAADTKQSVARAIEFANALQGNLHLLQRFHSSAFSFKMLNLTDTVERDDKLHEFQETYSKNLNKGLVLFTALQNGKIEKAVASYSVNHCIDLVVVDYDYSRNSVFNEYFNISRLANKLDCPVLTLPKSALLNFKTIVLPIGEELPINKIRIAHYLGKLFNASIHLICLLRDGRMNEGLGNMKKAYQLLKDHTDLAIVCKAVSGESLGKIVWEYAYSINAGLIIVNPRSELLAPGFVNRLFSRSVPNESIIPVMTVK